MSNATPAGASAEEVMDRFHEAWNRHDLPAALAMTSTNCVFEETIGEVRSVGRTEIEAVWKPIFADLSTHITVEESFTAGESFTDGTRVVQRWRFEWSEGCVRGVDLLTVRDGLITEKLAYIKV
ncbi:MAG TPA: nuclear transport factor 2 family protein [Streptosporangiaceae bacterium]